MPILIITSDDRASDVISQGHIVPQKDGNLPLSYFDLVDQFFVLLVKEKMENGGCLNSVRENGRLCGQLILVIVLG